jgi:hypothetical protein
MIKHFKNPKHATHLLYIHPMVVFIMADMIMYIASNGYTPMVTSVIRSPHEDRKLGAQSTTHQGGRSFDLRCNDWSDSFKKEFQTYFVNKYKGHGAISAKSGQENLIYIHGNGDNEHVHVQLNQTYGDPLAWMKV